MLIQAVRAVVICISSSLILSGCTGEEALTTDGSSQSGVVPILVGDGSNRLNPNEEVELTWEVNADQPSLVNVEVSYDGGKTWYTIQTNLVNEGKHTITSPNYPGTITRVRVIGQENQQVVAETEDITIVGRLPEATIESGLKEFPTDSSQTLKWGNRDASSVSVLISIGDSAFVSLVDNIQNLGEYDFTTPSTEDTKFVLRVIDSSTGGPIAQTGELKTISSETIKPTVNISSAASSPTNKDPISMTITFSEDVSGFSLSDIQVSGGTVSNLTGSGETYTVDWGFGGIEGNYEMDIEADVALSLSGGGNVSSEKFETTFDNSAPTVVISSTSSDPTASDPIPFVVTFSEPVADFSASDILVSGGVVTNFSGEDDVYRFDLDIGDTNGIYTVDIAASAASDLAENGNTAAPQIQRTYDNSIPTVTVSTTASNPTNTDPIPITVTFSESVTGFTPGDIQLPSGSSIANFAGSGSSYSFDLNVGGTDGSYSIDVPADVAQNAALTNNLAAASFVIDFDDTPPTLAIGPPSVAQLNSANSVTYEVVYANADTVHLQASDLTINGAIVGCVASVSDAMTSSPEVTITGCSGNGSIHFSIGPNTAADSAGNNSLAQGPSSSTTIDNISPTVSFSTGSSNPNNSNTFSVTMSLSEPPSGTLNSSDVTVTDGSISNFIEVTSTQYTFDVTDSNGQPGVIDVDMAASAFTDSAGNGNLAPTTLSYNFQPVPGNNMTLAGTVGTTSIDLSWNSPNPSASGYKLAYSQGTTAPTDCNSGDTQISSAGISGTSHTVGSLLDNTSYSFRLCAVNAMTPTPDESAGVTWTGTTLEQTLEIVTGGYSMSAQHVLLFKNDNTESITLTFNSTTTSSFTFTPKVYGAQAGYYSEVMQAAGDEVFIPAGSNSVSFDLHFPNTMAYADAGFMKLVFDDSNVTQSIVDVGLVGQNAKRSFDTISAGWGNTCAIDSGELYCWGWNNEGQLGAGTSAPPGVFEPTRVGLSSTWSQISVGRNFACALNSGELFCWGTDFWGQQGNGAGSGADVYSPEKVGTSSNWTQVTAGDEHTCGINSGELYCWGFQGYGRLGNGSTASNGVLSPQRIGISDTWSQISAGKYHTCGIDTGELYCWGRNSSAQVGNGSISSTPVSFPEKIGPFTSWTHVSAGDTHTCGISLGELYCWGDHGRGQAGTGSGLTKIRNPTKIGSSSGWTHIEAGGFHTCGIDTGELFCWGADNDGQVGNGYASTDDVTVPEKIGTSTNWTDIATGRDHACGISGGVYYCWGEDTYGQLANGEGASNNVHVPEKMGTSTTWSKVTAGPLHTCGIDSGALFCWGRNIYGQLGQGIPSDQITAPQRVGTSESWTDVSAGQNHSCGLDDGKLYCWGYDYAGQVGNGAPASGTQWTPIRIGSSSQWQQISAGRIHTCGIDNGKMYCWGNDTYGQIGNGSTSTSNVAAPEQIGVSTTWTHVSAGSNHTCGLNAGELYCWGRDSFGQSGNGPGSNSNVTEPEKVGTSSLWTKISSGGDHTCGINSGELFCWGKDTNSQVGNGSATSSHVTSPEKIGSLTGWSEIAAGFVSTCGINAGEMYCWGEDYAGVLGNGPVLDSDVHSPEKIGSSTTWSSISSRSSNNFCGLNGGEMYCWGGNAYATVRSSFQANPKP